MLPKVRLAAPHFMAVLAVCGLLLATPPDGAAQATGTVQGRVVDGATQRPLEGTQVVVVGTGRGALTNAQGQFLILGVPAGDVSVRAVRIGYAAEERTVSLAAGATATVEFQLRIAAVAIDEIVVTGVGEAARRRELSSSVAVIGRDEIEAAAVQSVDQLLQGRVAGATVNAISAQPGTASLMNFRGISSVFGSQTPVIYVDGVRVDNAQSTAAPTGGEQTSALADILVADIERIEITKGGAASTLFGSDAATGVIQIFTRRGMPGAARVTARIEQGFDTPELKYIMDTGMIYPEFVWAGHPNFNPGAERIPPDFLARNFFQTGHYQSYNVSVSGGMEDVTYAVSGRVQQSDGIQPDNQSEIFNLRGNVSASLTPRVRAQFTGGYTRSGFGRIFNGDAIADPLTALEVGDVMFFTGLGHSPANFLRAFDIYLRPEITESVNRFQFSTGLQYEATERFSSRVTVGLDSRANQQRIFQPIGFTPGNPEGSLNRRDRDFLSVTMDAAATYAYPRHGTVTSSLTVGVQGFRDNTSIVNAFGRGFALPGTKAFDEAADITAFEQNQQVFTGGLYIDERIGLWDRLFLNLGVRIDAGTSFGDEVDYEVYPKAGLAYNLADEPFFRDAAGDVFDHLRLRVAYGQTGKFPPPFLRDRTFSAISFRGESAPRFDNPGNPDLRPEVTETFEAGLDLAFLSNRVGVDFTYFDARTRDALFFVPEQPVTGQGTQIRNVGSISNTGIEVDVNARIIHRPRFSWQVGATYQTVDNEVTDMGGAAPFNITSSGTGGMQQRVEEGHQVGAWRVTTPIDTSGDGNPDDSEFQFTGKGPTPTRSGSFNTSISLFGNLQLAALADWAGGHQVYDWGSVWATFNGILRREIVDCPPQGHPSFNADCEPRFRFPVRHDPETGEPIRRYTTGQAGSAFLLDGDWFKLREISARYNMPASWTARFGANRGALTASARNVAIFSDNKLVDPELAGFVGGGLQLGGTSSITVSPPRAFRFGVEFTF
jgi:TonB-dependent starch-binding outer membrane protein SusC